MNKLFDCPVGHIAPFRDRDRDPEKFAMLVDSIRQHGVIEPIVVSPEDPGTGVKRYKLIAGHGRLRAAKKLGLQKIPAMLRDKFELRDYILENWRRELAGYEAAVLVELDIRSGIPAKDVAEKFSLTETVVKNYANIIRSMSAELHGLAKEKKVTLSDAQRIVKKLPEQKAQETLVQHIRNLEKAEPSKAAVQRAIEDVTGAIKVKGVFSTLDSLNKLHQVKEEVKEEFTSASETLSIVRSHWLKSVGELRLLLKDQTYRKLFVKHEIDCQSIVE